MPGDEEFLVMTASSHGVVARSDAIAAVGEARVRTLLRRGLLAVPYPGVLRVVGAPESFEQRVLGAVLSARREPAGQPGTVASHRTAVQLWGLSGFGAACVDVTVARRQSTAPPGVFLHRQPDLAPSHQTVLRGVPVVTPARALLDIATLGLPRLTRRALEDWVARRIVRPAEVERILGPVSRRGRPGVALLRAVLQERSLGDAMTDSPYEARLADLLVAGGLPCPAFHHLLEADGVVLAELDLAYPHERLAIEVMGYGPHSARAAWARDIERRNAIELVGWRLLEFAPSHVDTRPAWVVGTVRAALQARAA